MNSPSRPIPSFLDRPPRPRAEPAAPSPAGPHDRRIPGEAGLWFFLLGDMTLFGVFFVGFAVQMSGMEGEWASSAAKLHGNLGLANTVILLTSSFFVSRGVAAWHRHASVRARIHLLLAASLGVTFIAVKILEYALLTHDGVTPTSDLFFTYYFVLTGIHLLHVIIGVVVLVTCVGRLASSTDLGVEGSASYWHMVDVLWVILFPLLYLVGKA